MMGPHGLLALIALTLLSAPVHAEGEAAPARKALYFKDVSVAIVSTTGKTVLTQSGQAPKQLLSNPQVPPQHTLEVTLAGVQADTEEFRPQQAMLQVRHKASGVSAYFGSKAKSGPYKFSVTMAAVEKQIGRLSGGYTVMLLAGDPVASTVAYDLGSVELMLAEGQTPAAAPSVRTVQHQPTSNLKPEIRHMFRAPEKRPPAMVSLVFTGVAVAPLLVVVLAALTVVKVNFNAFPKDGTARLAALVFHGLLAAMLVVYLLFWTQWDLVTTLPRVMVLGVGLAVAGHRLLSSLSATRLLKKD